MENFVAGNAAAATAAATDTVDYQYKKKTGLFDFDRCEMALHRACNTIHTNAFQRQPTAAAAAQKNAKMSRSQPNDSETRKIVWMEPIDRTKVQQSVLLCNANFSDHMISAAGQHLI